MIYLRFPTASTAHTLFPSPMTHLTNRKWYPPWPPSWYRKTIPSRDVFPFWNPHSAFQHRAKLLGGEMISGNVAISNETGKSHCVVSDSRESSEQNLLTAAKAGHAPAFSALCERYTPQLLRAALRITRNREDSEDAVQEALLSAFLHFQNFDGRSSFSTWVTRIAINSALMILRKKRTALESATVSTDDFAADGPVQEIADQTPNPEKLYAKLEEERILRKAVRRLRPALRQAVEVHQLQELSMSETADAMCISVAAAKGRLFHAKVALRRSPILRVMYPARSAGEFRAQSAA